MSTEAIELYEESCKISSSIPRKRQKRNTSDVRKSFTKLPRTTSNERLKAQRNVCKKILAITIFLELQI